MDGSTIRFTLSPEGLGYSVGVTLRRAGTRWVARLDGAGAVGIGASPRAALSAVLKPLGQPALSLLLADLGLLEPSLRVRRLESASQPA